MHKPKSRADDSTPLLGLLAIAAAAAMWALGAAVARKLFDRGVDPLELSAARATVAALGLGIVGRGFRPSAASGAGWETLAFGMSIALVTATYYVAIEHLAVAVAVVLQYSAPALVVIWVALSERRWPRREVLIALVLALAGVVLASELAGADLGDLDLIGIAMGLASAVCFATYTVFSEAAGRRYGPVGAMFRAFAIATAFWWGVTALRGWPDALFRTENVVPILFVGTIGTLVPFSLYVWGIRRVRPERAVIAATLEPPFAALVAWVWLGQELSAMQLAGGALVIVAVVALQLLRARPADLPIAPETGMA